LDEFVLECFKLIKSYLLKKSNLHNNFANVGTCEKLDESVRPIFDTLCDSLLHVDLSLFQPLGHFRKPVAFLVG